MRISGIFRTALAAVTITGSAGLHAQDSAESLDQRLRVIERQLEIQAEEAQSKARDAAGVGAGEKGFSLKSANGDYELKLRALLQLDGRGYLGDATPHFNDTFLVRRLRPGFEGSAGKLVGFRFTPEFAGAGATVVDAYLDLKFHPAATLRAGKFKSPVGLERYYYSTHALPLLEFGFPTELAPNRDLGLQLLGEVLGSCLSYQLAYTNGAADGRDAATTDVDNRKEVAARIFAEPFRNSPGFFQGLGFGVAGTSGTKLGVDTATTTNLLPKYRTPGQNAFFAYDVTVAANGSHTRWSPQAYFYRNSFGLIGEYIESGQALSEAGVSGDVKNTAWQTVASYVLTGEDASTRGVTKPGRPYAAGGDGWGALEFVARYGELDIGPEAFDQGFASVATSASKASAFGAGFNWYLTSNAKLALDYNRTAFDGGAAVADREDEQALFTRFQISY
jgi:phosphate-selective porin OprO/OprP